MGSSNSTDNKASSELTVAVPQSTKAIVKFTEEYSVGDVLGEGAFGTVYACSKKTHGEEELAVKIVPHDREVPDKMKEEAEVLKSMDHRNIVRFHDVFFEKNAVCIVMDKYCGGDLIEGMNRHMWKGEKIGYDDIVHISQQMAASIQYLHSKNIVHRDIKGENFLMDRQEIKDPECHTVLIDFGTVKHLKCDEELLDEQVGTPEFWAPEVYDNCYGFEVDVWAMGVVMYVLTHNQFPFKNEDEVKTKEPKLEVKVTPPCEDYLSGMLDKNRQRRKSADAIMIHTWVSKLDVPCKTDDDDSDDCCTSCGDSDSGLSDEDETTTPSTSDFGVESRDDGQIQGSAFQQIMARRQKLLERLDELESLDPTRSW